jgi:hypothetical protein
MVLRLDLVVVARDTERLEIVTQARQRALVQKAGQIVGTVRHQLAASEADEQVKIFARDLFQRRICSGFGKFGVCDAERARIAVQFRELFQQRRVRGTPQQRRQEFIFLRAASLSSMSLAELAPNRSGRKVARSTPVATSTETTRSTGTRSQLNTDGCEIPIRRASSLTLPAARIASWRPGSRILVSAVGMLVPVR